MHVTTKTLQAEGKCGKLLHTRGFGAGIPAYCANEMSCKLHPVKQPVNKTNMPTLLSIIQARLKDFKDNFYMTSDGVGARWINKPIWDVEAHYHDTIVAVLEGVNDLANMKVNGRKINYLIGRYVETNDVKGLAEFFRAYREDETLFIKEALKGMKKV